MSDIHHSEKSTTQPIYGPVIALDAVKAAK